MRYQIYEAKSVKHDAQQRVGVVGASLHTLFRPLSPHLALRCIDWLGGVTCMQSGALKKR